MRGGFTLQDSKIPTVYTGVIRHSNDFKFIFRNVKKTKTKNESYFRLELLGFKLNLFFHPSLYIPHLSRKTFSLTLWNDLYLYLHFRFYKILHDSHFWIRLHLPSYLYLVWHQYLNSPIIYSIFYLTLYLTIESFMTFLPDKIMNLVMVKFVFV